MSILELPIELLQLIVDIAVLHTDLQHAVRFRETCRQFNEVVQSSILQLPKTVLLQWRLSTSMRRRFVRSKMLRGDANDLLLCCTINRTADYLADRPTHRLRDRYVQVLETAAVDTLMYWRLLDCLATERQRYLPLEELRNNALVAAVGAEEMATVQMLLEEGANPASNTPLFGEPLAIAASSGSLDMVHLLLTHWDWENHVQLTGIRLAKAIEAAAVAGHESVLAKLLDHKDCIAWSAYDDAIVRMIECNRTVSVERLLALRQGDSTSAARDEFWLRVVRTAAEYGRRTLLQRILAEHLPNIGEFSLVIAMQDACRENHRDMLQIIIPHLPVSDPTLHEESVFWAAWHGNVGSLQHLLTFLKSDQRILLVAFAGAVSGKASGAIEHLFKVAGVSPIGKDGATRFTDIAHLIHSNMTSNSIVEPPESLSASDLVQKLRVAVRTGELAELINVCNALRAHHPNHTFNVCGAFSDAARTKRLDVLLFLCENLTPYLITSCVKSPAVAQIFIDFGWDINQNSEDSKSPRLGSFVYDKHFIRWLLDKGASADARGVFDITAVSVAIMHASIPTVKLLLNRSSGIKQGQLLHFAVERKGEDSLEIVELLLNLGCPIDSIKFRNDPRSWLEWSLLEAGTALFTAAELGRDDIVTYLLCRGADASMVSNKGRTALDVAEDKQQPRVIQLLRQ